jgi:hypothetical protein
MFMSVLTKGAGVDSEKRTINNTTAERVIFFVPLLCIINVLKLPRI